MTIILFKNELEYNMNVDQLVSNTLGQGFLKSILFEL